MKPTLQEAWEMLSSYIERDLEPLGGQEGTAELWQSFAVVEKAIKPLLSSDNA